MRRPPISDWLQIIAFRRWCGNCRVGGPASEETSGFRCFSALPRQRLTLACFMVLALPLYQAKLRQPTIHGIVSGGRFARPLHTTAALLFYWFPNLTMDSLAHSFSCEQRLGAFGLRKINVIAQFCVALAAIMGTIVMEFHSGCFLLCKKFFARLVGQEVPGRRLGMACFAALSRSCPRLSR